MPKNRHHQKLHGATGHGLQITMNGVRAMEAGLEAEAGELVARFYEARKVMQEDLDRLMAPSDPKEKKPSFYSPLNLGSAVKKGALEIRWQQIHVMKAKGRDGKKHKRRVHIRKRNPTQYNLRDLLSVARDFEQDLVIATETEARALREAWALVRDIRRAAAKLHRRSEEKPQKSATPPAEAEAPAPPASQSPVRRRKVDSRQVGLFQTWTET